jgi:ABC-type Na+ efflux pump permease subunit
LGLSESEIASVVEPVPMTITTIEERDPQDDARSAAAFVGAILLYASIVLFGQFVAMGTVEEKQNRVVEVILSRVRPWQVLVGKVAGIGLLGLMQLVALAGAAYVSAELADFSGIDVAAIGVPIIISLISWFVLGYAFYAFLYAAVGSTVSRQEDLQGAIILPIGVILPAHDCILAASLGTIRDAGTNCFSRSPDMGDPGGDRRNGARRHRARVDRFPRLLGSASPHRKEDQSQRSMEGSG